MQKSRAVAVSFGFPGRARVISTASARQLRVAMSRPISPQSRISRKLAPGGLASHGRPRNAVSPIRNCQNHRMARDLLRKGRAHNSGRERRLRCALAAVAASEPAIAATATKAANIFLILGLLCVLVRHATASPRCREVPAVACHPPAASVSLIGADFELLVLLSGLPLRTSRIGSTTSEKVPTGDMS